MSIANTDFADVPAVLPGSENDEEREKLIMEAAGKSGTEESDIVPDDG